MRVVLVCSPTCVRKMFPIEVLHSWSVFPPVVAFLSLYPQKKPKRRVGHVLDIRAHQDQTASRSVQPGLGRDKAFGLVCCLHWSWDIAFVFSIGCKATIPAAVCFQCSGFLSVSEYL